jgi:hypothetical protein
VSVSVQLGLLLALATAFTSVVGFLYKFRGAQAAPEVEWRRPLHSSIALFQSGWYTLGILVAIVGWGFHVAALSLAPISLVQSVIAGGLVLLTVVADRIFGFAVSRREWIGVALTAAGLAFLAATLAGAGHDAQADYTPATLAIYVGALSLAGVLVAVMAERPRRIAAANPNRHAREIGASRSHPESALADSARSHRRASGFALSAGLLWAASDTSIKALSGQLGSERLGVLLDPLALVILIASLVGLLVSARSLQLGDAVPVIAVTSAAANVCTIAAGPVVFGEPMPSDGVGLAARLLAFGLVVGAAALTPPPVRPINDTTAAELRREHPPTPLQS